MFLRQETAFMGRASAAIEGRGGLAFPGPAVWRGRGENSRSGCVAGNPPTRFSSEPSGTPENVTAGNILGTA
jgi:hypothetical protein